MTLAYTLWFVAGLFIGANLSVGLMCLLQINRLRGGKTINFETILAKAKEYSLEHPEDCHLAVYMVRDYPKLRDLGMLDMAWAFHREGYVSPGDAAWFFEEIDKRLITGDPRERDR